MKIVAIVLSIIVLALPLASAANWTAPSGQPKIGNAVVGDANHSGYISVLDALYIVKFIEGKGPAPQSLTEGDANGDCAINLRDVTYLLEYYKGLGPAPHSGNCH